MTITFEEANQRIFEEASNMQTTTLGAEDIDTEASLNLIP